MSVKLRILDKRCDQIRNIEFYTYFEALMFLATNARRKSDVVLLLKELDDTKRDNKGVDHE